MVTQDSPSSPDSKPSPEFSDRCLGLIRRWEKGELPVDETNAALKSLAQEAAQSGHTANQGRAEHLQGYLQSYRGNYNVSIMHYEKARRLFSRVNNREYIAKMDLNQGENYRYKGEYKRARRLYRNAYELANDVDDILVQTIAIVNEGLVLISTQDYVPARRALLEGLELSQQWSDEDAHQLPSMYTEIYHGLAKIELAQKNINEAWDYALKSLQQANDGGDLMSIGLAYRILGDVMTEDDEPRTITDDMPETPDDAYREAVATFKEIGAEGEIGITTFNHAESLAARGRRSAAAKLFRRAMVIFTQHGMTDDAAKAAEAQLQVI